MIFWAVHYVRVCKYTNPTGGVACETRRFEGGFFSLDPLAPVHIAAVVVGVPLLVLATGMVLAWIARGFRST